MAAAPVFQATKDRWIVKDLFDKNVKSLGGSELFLRTETSANGRDGFFNSKEEALEAIEERKLETGRGLSSKEINKKYKKFIKAEGLNSWEEADKKAKSRIKQAYRNEKFPYQTQAFFKKEGLSKRINVKTRELLEKKKPINPRTGLPYTLAEYTDLTPGQKTKLSLRMRGLKRKDQKYKPRQGYYPEKDANRLINYMKIAAERQEKAGIPTAERTYTNVFDKNNKFVGVNDVRQNQLFTHVDYDLSKTNALAGKIITQHPDYENMQGFFKVAKRFKYESPDKLLGSYFAKYERVPTYNEIYNFFTTDRNAPLKTFKNNALTLQHQELISKEPTKNFQLLTQIKNTQAATIMNRFNNGEISAQLADYELKKIGAAQEGLGVAAETITPGKGLGVAKRESVKLFKDAVKINPNVVEDITSKLQIKLLKAVKNAPESCGVILSKATGGIANTCAEAITKDPVGSAQKLQNLDAQSGPLAKVKNAAMSFLKSPGLRRFTLAGAAGAGVQAIVKEFRNDDPTSYLSNEDQQKNMLVAMATDPIAPDLERPAILDYQLPALGASVAGSTALVAPSTIKASRSRGLGVERKGVARTAGRVLGRGLGVAAAPGFLAPLAAMDIASQVAEGDSVSDLATDPLNYLYPAFADQTPKLTRGLPSAVRGIASLGMSPAALRLLSRAGLLGLGASLGLQGMKLLQDD